MKMEEASGRPKKVHIDLGQNFAVHLMQHLVVPTFVLDAECNVLIWNKACERLTGIKAEEVIGTRDHWRAFYESPRPCLADLLAQGRMDEAKSLYTQHDNIAEVSFGVHAENWCVMPCRDTRLYLAIDAGPIYDESGRLLAVIETLRDVTEHRNAQTALEKLASRDGLTGVANRRSFDERLANEWMRDRRGRKALSLLMIDVDHFKRYNDTYGHQAGDTCLQKIAQVLEQVVHRPGDLVARYGGEEFAVILSSTDTVGAQGIAQRVLDHVAALEIPHGASELGRVSLSIGVSTTHPAPELTEASLIASADSALYEAKHAGRNRVVAAQGDQAAK
ncbi:MAG: sensor domain-containing diguanylate cyclase [Sulfuritalea sp.]|nr:sensor domain-containing diguanylate cyclase [Sulfuritalea sp.]